MDGKKRMIMNDEKKRIWKGATDVYFKIALH